MYLPNICRSSTLSLLQGDLFLYQYRISKSLPQTLEPPSHLTGCWQPRALCTSIDIWLITLTEVNYCRMASTWGPYLGHRNQRKWSIFFISCLSIVSKHPGMCVRDSWGVGIAAGSREGAGTAECFFSPVCFSTLFKTSAYWYDIDIDNCGFVIYQTHIWTGLRLVPSDMSLHTDHTRKIQYHQ